MDRGSLMAREREEVGRSGRSGCCSNWSEMVKGFGPKAFGLAEGNENYFPILMQGKWNSN
jgi:hypothetical protein